MKILNWAAAGVALLALAACAPSTAPSASGGDDKSGTLRVWLFDEPNRAPKEKIVGEAIKEFGAANADVKVEVTYIPTTPARHEKFKGAFNDPASAPDVAEYGNTDLAEYAAAGGFADLSADLQSWTEGKDVGADLLKSATVDGKVYGLPWYIGIRALYYRTDVFEELGLKPPTTIGNLTSAAREIRKKKPELYGIAVGGEYTFGALPFVWDAGGDIESLDSPEARKGVQAYTDLLSDDNCPPQACASLTGGKTVELFASGKAAMGILGNFSRSAVDAGAAAGKYAVVPLPGAKEGTIAPAFSGGNNLGVMKNSKHRSLAVKFLQLLGGKAYQTKMYEAMGNLPTLTSARDELAAKDSFLKPFLDTVAAGTRFVPIDPAWVKIDNQKVIPTMLQKIATKQATVEQATDEAAAAVKAAFGRS
ncbi:extracellular solute-binding protein [Streptosporangium roseum]|uniref:ABC-type sugar transport system periplasmic component-like protein n=1 Tax=Streptosporangium roseum (strain ATCC 12428 / DSM 43021 / JCM 3005 / KCTC 9067 / NCIMB 10171 / NRRL 2505 / NI 9100) TaxID=479432 RepID=D2ASR8_STRRD|nr:extracellular solute-binding protein [Streptosporangium roseum]ACZ90395.1 ABC-type sugar transport system periplasmic component-like protein [Streptosporangium roseum DSM 43021]